MKKANSNIYLNGQWKDATSKDVDSLKPGILMARGVFETMRVFEGKIVLWEQHVSRLTKGLKLLNVSLPMSKDDFYRACCAAIKRSALQFGRIRLMVFKKNGQINVAILCFHQRLFPHSRYQTGYKGIVSSVRHPQKYYSSMKTLDYVNFFQAYEEARRQGIDEAILLSKTGKVVEGSVSSIFMVKNGIIFTAPLRLGALNGVMRQCIIEKARQLGFKVKLSEFSLKFLLQSDEVFLTNAMIGVMPLVKLNKQKIGLGRMGEVSQCLLEHWWHSF